MGFWFTLFLWAASFVISDYFRPRLPSQTPAGLGDFNIPTATEGRYIPIMTGTLRVNGPNCVWYGDYVAEERTVTTGLIFQRDEAIGFTYFLALQYAQVHNQVAGITGVWIGDDKVFDGAATDVVDVDRDDLFGGADSGGGFVGRIRLFDGAQDQAVSAYLNTRLSPLPAYRGTSYIMITNIAETGGANIGEANQMREIRVELQAFDTVANGALGDVLGLGNDHHFIGADINPISFAYEVFTNTDWGGGFSPSEFNLTNLKETAETIFTEGLGFARLYDDVLDAEDVIDEIEQHIDGYIGPNPVTGKIEVIIIRNDYVLADEFQADASNILAVPKWSKSDWSQTINEIHLQYADRAKSYKDTFAKAQSLSNRIIQGRAKPDDIRLPGVHTNSVANQIVWRTAKSRFRALTTGNIELDQSAFELRPGSVLSFTDLDSEETDLPCRVISIGKGELNDLSISVEVVEDVFGNETVGTVATPASDFVPPIQSVVAFAALDQAAATVPRTLMQYDLLAGIVPRIVTFARKTGGSPTKYEVIRRTRATFGSGSYGSFASSGFVNAGFCTCGALRNVETAWESGNGTLTMQIDIIGGESLDGLIGIYSPTINNAAGIAVINPGAADEEWIAFTSIVDDLTGIRLEGLYRSAFDAPMISHAVGARIWFIWTGGMGLPEETYAAGNGVEVKLLPSSPNDEILEAGATAITEIDMLDTIRHARPLLPRTLNINDTEFPSTADAEFVAATGPTVLGLRFNVFPRIWNSDEVIDQVQGLNILGVPITDAGWLTQGANIEYWLYDLDDTPTPVRGDALITDTLVWDTAEKSFIISRDDLEAAGVTGNFAGRIEIEIEHSPPSETADQISKAPLIYDFDITGTFAVLFFPYSDVSFHSHFDGTDAATTAIDNSDQAATITFVGNAQIDTAQSVFGGASLLLDGTGDYCTVPDHATLDLSNSDFTIEGLMRFNGDPGTANMALASKWTEAGNLRSWFCGLRNNALVFQHSTNGTDVITTLSEAWNPAGDTWYHVAFVRDGSAMRVFVDGVQLGTDDSTVSTDTFFDSTALAWFGAFDGTGNDYMNGWIDEVRILKGTSFYTGTFTPPTAPYEFHLVAQLADFNGVDAATAYTEESRYQGAVTFAGNAQLDTAQSKFGESSLLLDGTGDYVTLPDNAGLDFAGNDWTIEGHLRFNALAGNDSLFTQWEASGQRALLIRRISAGIDVIITINGSATNFVATAAQLPWVPSLATWYHFALVRRTTTIELFIDGVSVGTSTTIGAQVIWNSTDPLKLGSHSGVDYFDGWMDEVRVTVGLAHYTGNFTPPSAEYPRI